MFIQVALIEIKIKNFYQGTKFWKDEIILECPVFAPKLQFLTEHGYKSKDLDV